MVALDEEQTQILAEISDFCSKIEDDLRISVNINEPHEIQYQIEKLRRHLSDASYISSKASFLLDFAKSKVADMIMQDKKLLSLKSGLQKMFIAGEINQINTLYVRTETAIKSLKDSISALVSLLSMEKEKIKHEI